MTERSRTASRAFVRFLLLHHHEMIASMAIAPSAAPMPIPAFAPVLSPDDDGVEFGLLLGAEADTVIVTGLNELVEGV